MGFARLNPILRPLFALLRLAGKKCLIGTKSPLSAVRALHTRRGTERDRFVADSALEGDGFELSVPREMGHRFELSLLFMSLKPSASHGLAAGIRLKLACLGGGRYRPLQASDR
jgi:hypothetical protein